MAKIKMTAIVADIRNKLNGTVFAKNRGGAYMRTKVTPVNRQTSDQSTVRNRLGSFAQGFRGLTQPQIVAWNNAVDNFKGTDIFGDIKTPSGINLYVKLNANLSRVAIAAIDEPPLPTSVAVIESLSATAAAGTPALSVVFTPTPVPADTSFVISATKQKSPGQSFFGGQYTDIAVVAAAGTSPANILAAYVAKYGTLIAGQKIGVKIQAINEVTGQAGIPLTTELIVAA